VRQITFGAPAFLWLLAAPAILAGLWVWRFARRRADLAAMARHRSLPVGERWAVAGDLPFWICATGAAAALVVALARPQGPSIDLRRAGIDIVVLQDASASMHVRDVTAVEQPQGGPTRWNRSVEFLRALGNALDWSNDRAALAAFARLATPQIRLTHDPNAFFFFLDHLYDRPPYRLEDDTTWDTNIELGIDWGLRILGKDAEINGPSPNGRVFIMISDGEAWSGEVARALEHSTQAGVPLYVIGVGSLGGGPMPVVAALDEADPGNRPPLMSRLDRPSLQKIAAAGGGRYFELGRDPDAAIANTIIDAGRRLAPASVERRDTDLHWPFLAGAAALAAAGLLFVRERAELVLHLAGAAATLLIISAFWR
jgi:Ca-activated chloride channel family protein